MSDLKLDCSENNGLRFTESGESDVPLQILLNRFDSFRDRRIVGELLHRKKNRTYITVLSVSKIDYNENLSADLINTEKFIQKLRE